MDDSPNELDKANCAFIGEGVIFNGSIAVPGKLIILGTLEGQAEAGELLVGTNGLVKGDVRVDQAYIQGTILDNIEARGCLRLRETGRIEGTAIYGEIEVEKGGTLIGRMSERGAAASESLKAPSVSIADIRSGHAAPPEKDKAVSF
jgi:cytoskeletal protein CcmA (bactofilin family)